MSRHVITVSIGAMGIVVGISIMVASNDQSSKVAGAIIAFLGMAMCAWSYKLALDDDHREIDKQRDEVRSAKEMVSELKDMNRNISGLVEEIRKDRNESDKGETTRGK